MTEKGSKTALWAGVVLPSLFLLFPLLLGLATIALLVEAVSGDGEWEKVGGAVLSFGLVAWFIGAPATEVIGQVRRERTRDKVMIDRLGLILRAHSELDQAEEHQDGEADAENEDPDATWSTGRREFEEPALEIDPPVSHLLDPESAGESVAFEPQGSDAAAPDALSPSADTDGGPRRLDENAQGEYEVYLLERLADGRDFFYYLDTAIQFGLRYPGRRFHHRWPAASNAALTKYISNRDDLATPQAAQVLREVYREIQPPELDTDLQDWITSDEPVDSLLHEVVVTTVGVLVRRTGELDDLERKRQVISTRELVAVSLLSDGDPRTEEVVHRLDAHYEARHLKDEQYNELRSYALNPRPFG